MSAHPHHAMTRSSKLVLQTARKHLVDAKERAYKAVGAGPATDSIAKAIAAVDTEIAKVDEMLIRAAS